MGTKASTKPRAWVLAMPGAEPDARTSEPHVWGLTARERLRRSLLRLGLEAVEARPTEAPPAQASAERWVVLRNDLFYDERLLAGLIRPVSESAVLMHPLGTPAAAGRPEAVAAVCDGARLSEVLALLAKGGTKAPPDMRSVGILDLAPAYDAALRKVAEPFVYPATSPAKDLTDIENRLFSASYKGVTDLVTKWVFPIPARSVVRVLARFHVHPNTVTAVSYALVGIATWLFAEGSFAAGLCVAWLMTFLDTVDGKLARCTLTSTRFGNVFDHGLDLVHPPIWWAAWGLGLPGGIASNPLTFWVVVGGYVVGRLLEGAFTWAFGIQFFVWRPFDSFFRQIIARRNPNLILLTLSVIAGRPDLGFTAVAVWTVASITVAATRNIQAHLEVRRGGHIRSWLDAGGPADSPAGVPGSKEALPLSSEEGISLHR